MYLTEVHLRNWRSYRNVIFRLPKPKGRRNVILIGADNGTGKTSFLVALYLALFGREAMHLIEGVAIPANEEDAGRTYRAILEQNLHRPAVGTDDPMISIKLRFEMRDGSAVVVLRRWNFSRGGRVRDLTSRDGEEVIVEAEGRMVAFQTWQEANRRIAELLFPANVMPCFFFDGEQARERVEAARGRALLDAVNTLYGTGLLAQLRQSLLTYIGNERTALRRDVGHVREDELDAKRQEEVRVYDQLEDTRRTLAERRKHHEALKAERARRTADLESLVGESGTDIQNYSTTISALEAEQSELRQRLTTSLSAAALPIALSRLSGYIKQTLEAEATRDRWLLLRDEAATKAAQIVRAVLPDEGVTGIEPPLVDTQIGELRRRLEVALERLWQPPPDGCAEDYLYTFLHQSERGVVQAKIKRLEAQAVPDLVDAVTKWQNVNARLKEARQKFENIKDIQPKLKDLTDQIKSLSVQIDELRAEIATLEMTERGLSAQLSDLRAAIGQMQKKQTLLDPLQKKIDVAARVVSAIDAASERLIPLCKKALEDRCTAHFSKMISDEFRNHVVVFDEEQEPILRRGSQEVPVLTLSGAQKRAFGLAFTLAIADVSGQSAPIIIDTPVGNMDSKYRDRVLRYVADAASGQVVFLSHDEEISEEYREKLDPKINTTMLVQFRQIDEGSGVSTVEEDAYFGVPA